MPTENSPFPPDFIWGAATASYQIEGAAHEDGRGESVWDRFCATPGKVRNGDSGDVACDFYHRYRDDVGLMRELGLQAFRFSIAWPRVMPTGRKPVNEAGLDFYDRLVDELLAHDIEPYATLFHWDTPQALEDLGGWPSRGTAEAFAEYAEAVARRLGDRVRYWITHNEPWVHAWIGHSWGVHAPGRTSEARRRRSRASPDAVARLGGGRDPRASLPKRRSASRSTWRRPTRPPTVPRTRPPRGRSTARATAGSSTRIFRGSYPADLLERNELVAPFVQDGDLETISAPLDFLGVNNYFRFLVSAGDDGPRMERHSENQHTDMGWEVYPDALRELLVRVAKDYGPQAIYVTENGAAFGDIRGHDGRVHDPERTAYIESYIGAVSRAVAEGAPVKGYFVWSLLDNFEWSYGYSKRFGIVYIDYPTLERVPKDSFNWYRDFISTRARTPRPSPIATG